MLQIFLPKRWSSQSSGVISFYDNGRTSSFLIVVVCKPLDGKLSDGELAGCKPLNSKPSFVCFTDLGLVLCKALDCKLSDCESICGKLLTSKPSCVCFPGVGFGRLFPLCFSLTERLH